MRLRQLKRVQLLKGELSKVWDYFSSPHNLREITPIWLNFKVLTVMEDKMYEGMIIEYTVSPFMEFSLKWITEITHLKEPYYFVDEQRFGPYRFWQHHHILKNMWWNRNDRYCPLCTAMLSSGRVNGFLCREETGQYF